MPSVSTTQRHESAPTLTHPVTGERALGGNIMSGAISTGVRFVAEQGHLVVGQGDGSHELDNKGKPGILARYHDGSDQKEKSKKKEGRKTMALEFALSGRKNEVHLSIQR